MSESRCFRFCNNDNRVHAIFDDLVKYSRTGYISVQFAPHTHTYTVSCFITRFTTQVDSLQEQVFFDIFLAPFASAGKNTLIVQQYRVIMADAIFASASSPAGEQCSVSCMVMHELFHGIT